MRKLHWIQLWSCGCRQSSARSRSRGAQLRSAPRGCGLHLLSADPGNSLWFGVAADFGVLLQRRHRDVHVPPPGFNAGDELRGADEVANE